MPVWVSYVGRRFSRALLRILTPDRGSNRDPFDLKANNLNIAIKAGLYRNPVQVYDTPNLYPVAQAYNKF